MQCTSITTTTTTWGEFLALDHCPKKYPWTGRTSAILIECYRCCFLSDCLIGRSPSAERLSDNHRLPEQRAFSVQTRLNEAVACQLRLCIPQSTLYCCTNYTVQWHEVLRVTKYTIAKSLFLQPYAYVAVSQHLILVRIGGEGWYTAKMGIKGKSQTYPFSLVADNLQDCCPCLDQFRSHVP